MLRLAIPDPLKQEFATVEALWHSTAETRRVDALVLSWLKYEKQLRRLFCFLLYQHPNITADNIDAIVAVLAGNQELYPGTFIAGIKALGVVSVSDLLARRYAELSRELDRIRRYRNKLVHGQITGHGIRSPQLERDVLWIVEWIACLATAAENTFGYYGLKRNTYRVAKATSNIAEAKYPFTTPTELKKWLSEFAKKNR